MKFATFAAIAAVAAIATTVACPDAVAQGKPAGARSCTPPPYPEKALRKEQSGLVEAAFLVGPDGVVQNSAVVTSSGVAELDRATVEGLGKCVFTPAKVDGQAVTRWQTLVYKWELDPPNQARPEVLLSLQKGAPAAQYLLALLYANGFLVGKDEQAGRRWLQVAAERGFDMAQFNLGLAYETGKGVAQDDTQAAVWYRKAADQGNIFAREKVQFGFGSIAGVPEAKN